MFKLYYANDFSTQGSLRTIHTMSTIPDIGLECHCFIKTLQLDGGSDIETRENMHQRIAEWVKKLFEWYGDDSWISDTDPLMSPHMKRIVQLLADLDALGSKLINVRMETDSKIAHVEKAYEQMMGKLSSQAATPNGSIEMKKQSLVDWKCSKIGALNLVPIQMEQGISVLKVQTQSVMDTLIDAVQLDGAAEKPSADKAEVEADDAIMMELEQLMAGCTFEDRQDDILRAPTLQLGNDSFDPTQDAQRVIPDAVMEDASTGGGDPPEVQPSASAAAPVVPASQVAPASQEAGRHLHVERKFTDLYASYIYIISDGFYVKYCANAYLKNTCI